MARLLHAVYVDHHCIRHPPTGKSYAPAITGGRICDRHLRTGFYELVAGTCQLPARRFGDAVLHHHRRVPVRHGHWLPFCPVISPKPPCLVHPHRVPGILVGGFSAALLFVLFLLIVSFQVPKTCWLITWGYWCG